MLDQSEKKKMIFQKFTVRSSRHVLFGLIAALLYYYLRSRNAMKLIYSENARNRDLEKFVFGSEKKRRNYVPPIWLVSGILQTISTTFLKSPSLPKMLREKIDLNSIKSKTTCAPPTIPRGEISLDWIGSKSSKAIVIVIVPGLTGSSKSGYVRRTAEYLVKEIDDEVRVAMYNPRGRGGNNLQTPFMYSAGYTEDLRRAIQHIKGHIEKCVPIFAIGYSLGSNVLAKYLGEEGESSPITASVCLATPIDLLSMSNHMKYSFSGMLMDRVLVRFVKLVVQEYENVIRTRQDIDLNAIETDVNTMSRFDRYAVAPQMNLSCSSEYYRIASSGLWLSKIRTPTLFIHSRNDPICPGDLVRKDDFKANSYLFSCVTQEGGHSMDWPSGWLCNRSWSSGVVKRFIMYHLMKKHNTH